MAGHMPLGRVLVACLALAAGACAGGEPAGAPPSEQVEEGELRAAGGRLEVFEESAGFGVAIRDAGGERLLVGTRRYPDRAAAEAGSAEVLGLASIGYAFFARPVDGGWTVELLHRGGAVARTPVRADDSIARKDVARARATIRAMPVPAAAASSFGGLRYALAETAGQYQFELRGKDGAMLLRSERYTRLASALHGIDNVFLYADHGDPRFEVREEAGAHSLHLVAYNGQTIGIGGPFATRAQADATAATITDLVEDGIPTIVE